VPELPDVTLYVEALRARVVGVPLEHVRLASPFILRTFTPRAAELEGKKVQRVVRMGKRIVFALEGGEAPAMFIVIHLMIAGRLRWLARNAKIPGKVGLVAFDFPTGTLVLTEAGTKRRASLHFFAREQDALALHAGGTEVMDSTEDEFAAVIARENHTLKRTLTDPRIFSGIGNAYSDEILHRAGLSPVRLSSQLTKAEVARLHRATIDTLAFWTQRLRDDFKIAEGGFPEKVTAFREGMAVHGRYGKPCPACGSPVQRIVHASNETNYCATCQTGGKLLADRSLSRLLKSDWPKTIEEMEIAKSSARVEAGLSRAGSDEPAPAPATTSSSSASSSRGRRRAPPRR
jgi:formamidopyrimidine-DNA glycosylase